MNDHEFLDDYFQRFHIIENTHQFWQTIVCDLKVGEAEYSAS